MWRLGACGGHNGSSPRQGAAVCDVGAESRYAAGRQSRSAFARWCSSCFMDTKLFPQASQRGRSVFAGCFAADCLAAGFAAVFAGFAADRGAPSSMLQKRQPLQAEPPITALPADEGDLNSRPSPSR